MKENLFLLKNFISSSGRELSWKIECDALSEEDWDTLAFIAAQKFSFCRVYPVPSDNGEKFAKALRKYAHPDHKTVLLVDDVLTSGASMTNLLEDLVGKEPLYCQGVVAFARNKPPAWVYPILQFNLQ